MVPGGVVVVSRYTKAFGRIMGGQVEVLVAMHTLPYALHVERDAVCGDALVVRRSKNVVVVELGVSMAC